MKILVIEEELGHKGEVFTVDWVLHPIDLKYSHFHLLIAVYLIPRRVIERTRLTVPLQLFYQTEEAQAKFANIQTVYVVIVYRIRTVVPRFRHILP